jgi:2,3-bisphosphoglycerate-dependent phosphoglycerate mutase
MIKIRGPLLTRRAFVGATGAAAVAITVPHFATAAGAGAHRSLQIWFIRHAESEINIPTNPRPVPDGGVTYPLTRKGVDQAKALAAASSAVPIMEIYTSTHLRAVQTADALAFQHGLTLSLAPEAVEIDFGIDQGGGEDVRNVYMELARRWAIDKDLDARHGAGESYADVQRRFLPFVREIMNRHAHDSGVIAIIAHGGVLGFMVPALASNVPADFALRHPLPNTGVIKTELRDSKLYCIDWVGIASTDFAE